MYIAHRVLTLASFGIGTTELVPLGHLPTIAEDLKVSLFAAGLLITGFKSCAFDQREIESRDDVLVYTTPVCRSDRTD
jgi:hypothetical protein